MNPPKRPPDSTARMIGLVIPVEWNEVGEPIGLTVSTYDENEYRVTMDRQGRALLGHLHREVIITGRVRETAPGLRTIKVDKFRPTGRPGVSES